LDVGRVKVLTYTTSILMRAIEGSDLEKRLEELEKRIK